MTQSFYRFNESGLLAIMEGHQSLRCEVSAYTTAHSRFEDNVFNVTPCLL